MLSRAGTTPVQEGPQGVQGPGTGRWGGQSHADLAPRRVGRLSCPHDTIWEILRAPWLGQTVGPTRGPCEKRTGAAPPSAEPDPSGERDGPARARGSWILCPALRPEAWRGSRAAPLSMPRWTQPLLEHPTGKSSAANACFGPQSVLVESSRSLPVAFKSLSDGAPPPCPQASRAARPPRRDPHTGTAEPAGAP